ncbi:MAG: ATP-binding protein [Leptolyngbyaceae cyanobacterium bins.59]|nr:ATP-binding protein [Leptolyngbyaceae cyanobacterium bins.59]
MKTSNRADETQRLQALWDHQILDTPAEPVFDRIVQAAKDICGVPIALVSLIDEHRQWFKAKVGIEVTETRRDISFCSQVIQQSDPFIIADTHLDEQFATHPSVINEPYIRFYAAVPLITPEGHALGTLCVIDRKPHTLTCAQIQSLKGLARQTIIELRRRRVLAQLNPPENSPEEHKLFFRRLIGRSSLAIGIILGITLLSIWSDAQVEERQRWVTHTLKVISLIESANADFGDLRWSAQSYVITAQEQDLAEYEKTAKTLQQSMKDLRQLMADNARQQANLNRLEPMIQQSLRNLQQTLTVRRTEGFTTASQLMGQTNRINLRAAIRSHFQEMHQEEERLLQERSLLSEQTHYFASAVSNAGRAIMVCIILANYGLIRREVRRRQQAETEKEVQRELLEVTLASIGDGVIVTDANQRVTFMNPIAETLTGWPEESANMHPIHEVFPLINLETGESVASPFAQAITEKRIQSLLPNTGLQQPDGSIIPIDDSCAPILDKQGIVQGTVMVFRDITFRKQSETEMQRALSKEKELNELRNGFVSMVSHDIRTPLAIIISSAELLQHYADRLTDEKRQRYFQQIRDAVKRMQELLEDVLLITKTESGGLKYEPSPVNLEEFCRNLVEEVQMTTQGSREIVFTSSWETANGSSPTYNMDPKLLHHIFVNLLSNAVKYSPQGGKIHFKVEGHKNDATFQIRDEGIGIPAEDLPKLFTSFHRGRNVGKIMGTGLGLSIVKSCVELHYGSIEVASEVGKGTTFTLTLPLNRMLADC